MSDEIIGATRSFNDKIIASLAPKKPLLGGEVGFHRDERMTRRGCTSYGQEEIIFEKLFSSSSQA